MNASSVQFPNVLSYEAIFIFSQSLFCFIMIAYVAPHTTSQAHYSFCPPFALLSLLLSVHILLLACVCGVLQPSHLSYYLTDKYVIVFLFTYIFLPIILLSSLFTIINPIPLPIQSLLFSIYSFLITFYYLLNTLSFIILILFSSSPAG